METLVFGMLNAITLALVSIWGAFLAALPSIFAAIIFVTIGYFIGAVAKKIVVKGLQQTKVDQWMEEQNLVGAIGNKEVSGIAGSIVKWYLFVVFVKQAVEIVQLSTLNDFLGFWINYVLLLIGAIVLVIVGLIVGRYVRNAMESTSYSMKRIIGLVFELVIVYVAVVMAIRTIGLPTNVLEIGFLIGVAGFVTAIGIAIGISFGLALKDEARTLIKEIKKRNN
jgi:hypothetical protein